MADYDIIRRQEMIMEAIQNRHNSSQDLDFESSFQEQRAGDYPEEEEAKSDRSMIHDHIRIEDETHANEIQSQINDIIEQAGPEPTPETEELLKNLFEQLSVKQQSPSLIQQISSANEENRQQSSAEYYASQQELNQHNSE